MHTKMVDGSDIRLAALTAVATLFQVPVLIAGLADGYEAYISGEYDIAYYSDHSLYESYSVLHR